MLEILGLCFAFELDSSLFLWLVSVEVLEILLALLEQQILSVLLEVLSHLELWFVVFQDLILKLKARFLKLELLVVLTPGLHL